MSRSAALARRLLARALGAAASAAGASSASPSSLARAPAALRAPAAASSWTLVSRARALSSAASSSSSIPSLTALMAAQTPTPTPRPGSAASSSSASSPSPGGRRALSSSAAPRKDDGDNDASPASSSRYRLVSDSEDDVLLIEDDDDDLRSAIIYPSPQAAVGKKAPGFTAPAVVGGEVRPLSLKEYRGRYVVLLWYPKDFTYVCPTELIAFSDRAKEFEELNCQVIAASTDSEECHLAWIKTPRHRGGLGYMQIPIVADLSKEIAARYGVLIKSAGVALRGLFLINPEGVIQHITINDLPIGRSVDEALRTLQAVRFYAEHGEVCPANWKPGDRGMHADAERAQEYFGNVYKEGSPAAGDDGLAPGLEAVKSRRDFDALLGGGKPFVLYVGAPWCGKCKQLSPYIVELAEKHPDLTFVKMDSTAEPVEQIAQELGVKALPATHFYGADGKPALPPITGYKRRPLEEAVAKLAEVVSGGGK